MIPSNASVEDEWKVFHRKFNPKFVVVTHKLYSLSGLTQPVCFSFKWRGKMGDFWCYESARIWAYFHLITWLQVCHEREKKELRRATNRNGRKYCSTSCLLDRTQSQIQPEYNSARIYKRAISTPWALIAHGKEGKNVSIKHVRRKFWNENKWARRKDIIRECYIWNWAFGENYDHRSGFLRRKTSLLKR